MCVVRGPQSSGVVEAVRRRVDPTEADRLFDHVGKGRAGSPATAIHEHSQTPSVVIRREPGALLRTGLGVVDRVAELPRCRTDEEGVTELVASKGRWRDSVLPADGATSPGPHSTGSRSATDNEQRVVRVTLR